MGYLEWSLDKAEASPERNPIKLASSKNANRAADGAGEPNPLNNFLATDDVPPTLFGFEVVTESYTDEDLMFFREHPDAGGYYDLGEDDVWETLDAQGVQGADGAGEPNPLNNFLATDDVPPTLFGFEVVTENYTDEDLKFFQMHPDAGGYYDLGRRRAAVRQTAGGGVTEGRNTVYRATGDLPKWGRTPTVEELFLSHPRLEARNPKNVPVGTKRDLEALNDANAADRRLADAGMTALTAAAGASSVPASALMTALALKKAEEDARRNGAEALLDPANLMILGSLKAARYGKPYRRPSPREVLDHADNEVLAAADAARDRLTGVGHIDGRRPYSEETFNLPAAIRRKGAVVIDPEDEALADIVQSQYEAAIGRTSSYRGDLRNHLLSGNGVLLPDQKGNYVAGFPAADDTFVLSHFAPRSLRGGVEQIKSLANDPDVNFIMAVPDYQANMAAKAGFRKVGVVPQFFNGELVLKNVMVNKRTPDDALSRWLSSQRSGGFGWHGYNR